LKAIPCLLLSCFAATASTLAAAQSPEPAKPTETLAVVVLAGEQLDLVRIGAMVFGNKRNSIKLPDNSFHDAIASAIASEINAEGQYKIRTVVPSQADSGTTRKAIQDALGGFFTRSFSTTPAELKAIAQQCECAKLLLVLGSSIADGPNSNQRFGPIAWVAGTGFGEEPSRTSLSIPLEYLLVDPSSLKLLANSSTSSDDNDRFVQVTVDPKLWHKPMLEVSAEAWTELATATKKLLAGSVKRPLYDVGLRPSCTLKFQRPQRTRAGEPRTEPQVPAGADPAKCV